MRLLAYDFPLRRHAFDAAPDDAARRHAAVARMPRALLRHARHAT